MISINLICVRHGQSEANVDPNIYFKKPDKDIDLTDLGKAQANNTARVLKTLPSNDIPKIVHSPWKRAKDTAILIHNELSLPDYCLIEDPLIYEISLSHSFKEMAEQPLFFFEDKSNYSHYWYKEGTAENYADVYQRARIFYQDIILNKYDITEGSNLIVVSHNLFLIMLKAVIDNQNIESISNDKGLLNAGYYTRSLKVMEK